MTAAPPPEGFQGWWDSLTPSGNFYAHQEIAEMAWFAAYRRGVEEAAKVAASVSGEEWERARTSRGTVGEIYERGGTAADRIASRLAALLDPERVKGE